MSVTMSNVDHFWLCMDEPTNLMMITGFMEFAEKLDYKRLCDVMEERLCCFDRFKMKVVNPISGVGLPSWEFDEHFDIRTHIHRVALRDPGDKAVLEEMVGDLMATPLDPSKPLWQFHLIENYQGGCALFLRLHHCIADGIACIYVMLSITDDSPGDSRVVEKCAPKAGTAPLFPNPFNTAFKKLMGSFNRTQKVGKFLVRGLVDSISNPVRLVEQAKNYSGLAADSAAVLAKLALMPPHPHNCFRGALGVRKVAAWTEPMSLGNIKLVGQAVEATLNDVLVATVTGALRRYLKTRHDNVNELELRVAVPVNVRKPGTEFELGNKFSLVFLSLPVHIEDPVLRLREVKRRMDELKTSPDAFVGFTLLNTLGMSPANVAKRAARLFANKTTGVLTNVPGPKKPLFLAGKPIKNMMFWVPRSGRVGLGISILSYNGYVTVGLASDEKLVPDPEIILEGFEEDFKSVLNIVESGKIDEEPLVLHDRYKEAKEKASSDKQKENTETLSEAEN